MCDKGGDMTQRMACISPALLALAVLVAPAASAKAASSGEAELAEMLEGRVAGSPVDCIPDHGSDGVRIVDGTAMVFRRGSTIYVNRLAGADFLDNWDLPVFYKWGGSKLCKLDRVELRHRNSHIPGQTLHLAEFVPYTRPAS